MSHPYGKVHCIGLLLDYEQADERLDVKEPSAFLYGAPLYRLLAANGHHLPCFGSNGNERSVPVYHTVYREKIVPAPIYKTQYKTLYHTQYHTQFVPKYVTNTNYNTKVQYVPEYTTQYHTQYQPKYVPKTEYVPKYVSKTQYHTEYYTQTQYKTVYNTQYVPEYVTKKDVQYQTRYHTQYVPQYQTVVKTQLNYKTYCPESSYGSY
ncbi:hypothetical protein E2C01_013361 [Portunus trituberculatus]|uniref:Uncharacterized protein n=1 Tax=Portunus trituberculatus TaxID=210409 RepID=A0A5B7DGF3_PORTR|nr:hypothetical protein [Portunus trituberculatus]